MSNAYFSLTKYYQTKEKADTLFVKINVQNFLFYKHMNCPTDTSQIQ